MGIAGPDGTIMEGLIFPIPRRVSRSSSVGLNITHQTLKLPFAVAMEVLMVTLVQRGYTLYNVNKQPRPIAWTPRRSWTFSSQRPATHYASGKGVEKKIGTLEGFESEIHGILRQEKS